MQAVIYYNQVTGTYIEFNIEVQDKISFSKNNITNQEIGKGFIVDVLPRILEFGGKIKFPKNLLEAFDDNEIDLFLLASYSPAVKEALVQCLYVVVPQSHSQTYEEIGSKELLIAEAVGSKGVIIHKGKSNGGLLATGVSHEELEMNFRHLTLEIF